MVIVSEDEFIIRTRKTIAGAGEVLEFLSSQVPEFRPLMVHELWDLVEKYVGLLNERGQS